MMEHQGCCNTQNHMNTENGTCGCKGPAHAMQRRFMTKAEKVERLKEYAEQLKLELQGVEEKLHELES